MQNLSLQLLPERLAICRLEPHEPLPDWVARFPFWSITRTHDELSIVMPEESVPAGWKQETGWRCLKVCGPLEFSVTGILVSLAAPLAEAGVSIFALSTYGTDYLLIREADLESARRALAANGHVVEPHGQARGTT